MESIGDWRRWFRRRGTRPVHARRWVADDGSVSGAVRGEDGHAWAWAVGEDGAVEAWPIDKDREWDQPGMVTDDMTEARGSGDCFRLLEGDALRGDPDAGASRRRDDNLRGVFG